MLAKDVMTTNVVTVRPDALVEDVARLLLARGISAAPVVDARGGVQGIVSEGDLMRRAETGTERQPSWWLSLLADRDQIAAEYAKSHGRTARDVMTREVITVGERVPLERIATLLERQRIKRVPVVRRGKLVGIVSCANLLRGLAARKPAVVAAASDRAIRARVLEEMRRAGVDQALLTIVVSKGVVQLWGTVDSAEQKRAARIVAQNARGTRKVVDNVAILPPKLRAFMGSE
jgi:CBS domain-containing protein